MVWMILALLSIGIYVLVWSVCVASSRGYRTIPTSAKLVARM